MDQHNRNIPKRQQPSNTVSQELFDKYKPIPGDIAHIANTVCFDDATRYLIYWVEGVKILPRYIPSPSHTSEMVEYLSGHDLCSLMQDEVYGNIDFNDPNDSPDEDELAELNLARKYSSMLRAELNKHDSILQGNSSGIISYSLMQFADSLNKKKVSNSNQPQDRESKSTANQNLMVTLALLLHHAAEHIEGLTLKNGKININSVANILEKEASLHVADIGNVDNQKAESIRKRISESLSLFDETFKVVKQQNKNT